MDCMHGMQDAVGMIGDGRRLKLFGTLSSLTWFPQLFSHKFPSKIVSLTQIHHLLRYGGTPAFIEVGEEQIWIKCLNQQTFQFRSVISWNPSV